MDDTSQRYDDKEVNDTQALPSDLSNGLQGKKVKKKKKKF